MTKTRKMILLAGIVAVGTAGLVTWTDGKKVSLVFRGFETNKYGIWANMEFTNPTRGQITYAGRDQQPDFTRVRNVRNYPDCFLQVVPPPLAQNYTLTPSSCVTFRIPLQGTALADALGNNELHPYKVAISYFPVRRTNGLWKYVPEKIRKHLPGQKDSYTIESPPIRL